MHRLDIPTIGPRHLDLLGVLVVVGGDLRGGLMRLFRGRGC